MQPRLDKEPCKNEKIYEKLEFTPANQPPPPIHFFLETNNHQKLKKNREFQWRRGDPSILIKLTECWIGVGPTSWQALRLSQQTHAIDPI